MQNLVSNADLGGIPKVEKLRRGQFKSWKYKWSFAEKIEWGKPSITVGLIFTISICTTKSCYGLKYHVKTNIVSPAKNFAFLANCNKKVLDFTVELSSYVPTNIKLLNWRWRRSKKYFILIETYNETKLNIFVELNPIVFIEVIILIYFFRHDCQCIWFVLYFLHLCQKLQTAVKAPLNQVDRVYAGASTNLWGVVCARNLHISAFLPQFVFWNKLIFKMFSLFLAPCYSDYFCLTHCSLTCD